MKAVILVGGFGTRLIPLTLCVPKPINGCLVSDIMCNIGVLRRVQQVFDEMSQRKRLREELFSLEPLICFSLIHFPFSAQQIWKVIKENKDLDLPAHKVMVATVRCEEIANEKYSSFVANEDWQELEEAVQSHLVPGFGKKLSSLLHKCLSSYDEEATYFEESVRSSKRKQLEEKLLQLVQPAYQLMLEHIRSGTLDNFKKALGDALNNGQGFAAVARDCVNKFTKLFDEQCEDVVIKQAKWDSAKVKDKFSRDLDSHIAEVRTAKLSELTALYESKLKEALYGPVEALLEGANDDTWPAIRKLLSRETEKAVSEFSFALSGFEMDEKDEEDMISKLKNYGRGVVEEKTREEAAKVLYRMKESL